MITFKAPGRARQPVGVLEQIAWIVRDRLFEPVAAARAAVSGRDDDDDVELARQFVERRRPGADLAAVKDAPAVGQRNDENPTAEPLVQRRDRLAHLRGHQPAIVEPALVVHHFRCAETGAALQRTGVELRAQVAKHRNAGHAGAVTPDVGRAEIGGTPIAPTMNIRQEPGDRWSHCR